MLYRDLSDAEKSEIYDHGRCPFCGSLEFYEGPHGGLSVNWYCAADQCLAGFVLAPPALRVAQLIRESYLWIATGKATLTATRMSESSLRSLFKRRTTLNAWFDMLKSSRWG